MLVSWTKSANGYAPGGNVLGYRVYIRKSSESTRTLSYDGGRNPISNSASIALQPNTIYYVGVRAVS